MELVNDFAGRRPIVQVFSNRINGWYSPIATLSPDTDRLIQATVRAMLSGRPQLAKHFGYAAATMVARETPNQPRKAT